MPIPPIKIYVKNFLQNGNLVSSEVLLQELPSETIGGLVSPKVKCELGKAPTFEFSLPQNHAFHDALLQMRTIFRVTYCGTTIFRGRVLSIKVDMYNQYQVHCEGDFAFLMDTIQVGTKEETRPTISVPEYMEQIIAAHNSHCPNETDKQFQLGFYPGHYPDNIEIAQRVAPSNEQYRQQFGDTSWNTSMDRMESLLSDFGGYYRTRYDESTGITYIDWMDNYYRHNHQSVVVARNLIELSASVEVDNIFTVVIPIGKRDSENLFLTNYWPSIDPSHPRVDYIEVPELVNFYSAEELNRNHHTVDDYANAINRYGYVFKTVNFENADMEDKLFSYAKDWIRRNYIGRNVSYEVTAIDLVNLDPTQTPILVGDAITLQHPTIDSSVGEQTVMSAEYDLYAIWKTKFKIGIPNEMLNASYGVKKKESGGGKGGGGGGVGVSKKKVPNQDQQKRTQDDEKNYRNFLTQYSLKTDYGSNIQLDDPLAFLSYNDKGMKLNDKEAAAKYNQYGYLLGQLMKDPLYKTDPEAALNKEEYLDLREARDSWKSNVQSYAISVGVPRNVASVLTNEKWANTWMAMLVDDEGNPKSDTYSPELIEMAKESRAVMKGEKRSAADQMFGNAGVGGYQDFLAGLNFDFGNGAISFDDALKLFDFDLGDGSTFSIEGLNLLNPTDLIGTDFSTLLNAEGLADNETIKNALSGLGLDLSKIDVNDVVSKLGIDISGMDAQEIVNKVLGDLGISDFSGIPSLSDLFGKVTAGLDIMFDSKSGTINAGKNTSTSSGWNVKLNDTITWTDEDGNVHTQSGTISTQDISMPEVPSLKTDFLLVKTLYAQEINAVKAKIEDLEVETAKIDRLSAAFADFQSALSESFSTGELTVEGTSYLNAVDISNFGLNGQTGEWHEFKIDGTKVAEFLGTDDVNFDRAAARREGAAGVQILSADIIDAGGRTWSSDNKSVYVQVRATATNEATNTNSLLIDTTTSYNAGWNDARTWMQSHSHNCLTGYTVWENGRQVNLYKQDSSVPGGFAVATGQSRVWRYGGSVTTYYELPAAK